MRGFTLLEGVVSLILLSMCLLLVLSLFPMGIVSMHKAADVQAATLYGSKVLDNAAARIAAGSLYQADRSSFDVTFNHTQFKVQRTVQPASCGRRRQPGVRRRGGDLVERSAGAGAPDHQLLEDAVTRRGMTLVETLVAAALFAVVMTVLVQSLVPGLRAWSRGDRRAQLQNEADVALSRLRQDVLLTSSATLTVTANQVQLLLPLGASGHPARDPVSGQLQWTRQETFYLAGGELKLQAVSFPPSASPPLSRSPRSPRTSFWPATSPNSI